MALASGDILVYDGSQWNNQPSTSNAIDIDSGTFYLDSTNDRVGIGTTSPSTKLHVIATTEQLRLGYDSSNYVTFTVASDGSLTLSTNQETADFFLNPRAILELGTSLTDAIRLGRSDGTITTTVRGTLALSHKLVTSPLALQTLAAANAISASATKVRVAGSGGAVTLTSTPTIADGTDGQVLIIQGTHDTNTVTVQDEGTLTNSNLQLGAATRVLGKGDILVLSFDNTDSVWYEVSFANN